MYYENFEDALGKSKDITVKGPLEFDQADAYIVSGLNVYFNKSVADEFVTVTPSLTEGKESTRSNKHIRLNIIIDGQIVHNSFVSEVAENGLSVSFLPPIKIIKNLNKCLSLSITDAFETASKLTDEEKKKIYDGMTYEFITKKLVYVTDKGWKFLRV